MRNLYGVLDRLRADHPALRIESCNGGGGRVDLGLPEGDWSSTMVHLVREA